MHPVGPLNPRVYWLRRVSVIVAAVIVLIGVGFLVVQKTRKSATNPSNAAVAVSASPTPTLTGVLASRSAALPPPASITAASSSPASSSASSKPVVTTTVTKTAASPTKTTAAPAKTTPAKSTPVKPPSTTPAKTTPGTTTGPKSTASTPAPTTPTNAKTTPKPTSTPPPAPSTDAQGRLLCPDASLKLLATTGSPSFVAGAQPILGVSVTNVGTVPCTRDLSGGLQVFTVYSAAGARIWSTADCFPGSGTDVRTLMAGQGLQYNIKWSGTTSNPGCTADRVRVPAGSYQLRVQIDSLRATPVNFTIA